MNHLQKQKPYKLLAFLVAILLLAAGRFLLLTQSAKIGAVHLPAVAQGLPTHTLPVATSATAKLTLSDTRSSELAPRLFPELTPGYVHGPGPSQVIFPSADLFQVISRINADNGAPRSHGSVSMHNGYLVVIFAIGGGRHVGGFAFYDISDPYNPTFVASKDDIETDEIREAHGYGYSSSYEGDFAGRDLVALQARRGVQIWDWTSVYTPTQVSYLTLPDISGGDYTNANWWTFWQAPYIYVAGADSGIYIIDATDPANPEMVNRIPNGETGGFRVGSLYAIGNLLVIAGNDVPGYATLDISDPVDPKLLDS